jgi:hypothetical protein
MTTVQFYQWSNSRLFPEGPLVKLQPFQATRARLRIWLVVHADLHADGHDGLPSAYELRRNGQRIETGRVERCPYRGHIVCNPDPDVLVHAASLP